MARTQTGVFIETPEMKIVGLTQKNLQISIQKTHNILDQIDAKLLEEGADRMSQMVELANLSSMVGNLLGAEIAKNSSGNFIRNGPHKFPDLLANNPESCSIEIKVALENNKPKGHLAKEGYYLTCRYVLVNEKGIYNPLERGQIVSIWEARFGYLLESHFNLSNTPGDSGKTAVINKEGMNKLKFIYLNINNAPYAERSITYKTLKLLISNI